MGHIQEKLALIREQVLRRTKRPTSMRHSSDVSKHIPQTGDDVELFIARSASQLLGASAPNLRAIGSLTDHFFTWFNEDNPPDSSLGGNTGSTVAIPGADVQQ